MLETVRGAMRGLPEISNCAFECDCFSHFYLLSVSAPVDYNQVSHHGGTHLGVDGDLKGAPSLTTIVSAFSLRLARHPHNEEGVGGGGGGGGGEVTADQQ